MNSLRYIIITLIVHLATSALPAYAVWQIDGNWVCNRINDQEQIEVIPDGTGGVIMVWTDPRLSAAAPDIYAQRFNYLGQPVWNENGVAICTANNIQEYPHLASDGAGGAIIAWADNRYVSGRDIYAQRIDETGNVLWGANGTVVCLQTGWQFDTQVVSDGAGGAIISWRDKRNSSTGADIYAQRFNALGSAQWTADGVIVCGAVQDQVELSMASDGAGGAILAWQDWRVFSDIYAQRINASGTPLWTADGVLVCFIAYVAYPRVVSDGKHGAIIAWEDNRSDRNIYAQRIGADGSALWTADGLPMCPSGAGNQMHMKLAPDGEGGAVMVVADDRPDYNIYAQKVDSLGNMLWGADGVGVCTESSNQFWPDLVSDGAGGAIVTWEDFRAASPDTVNVLAQRITVGGAVAWTANGVSISSATGIQRQARITSDGGSGAYVAWVDERGTSKDIYANHVNGDGLVPTLLGGFQTSITNNTITVRWTLTEAEGQLAFRVFRAEGRGAFNELTASPIERGFDYELVDADVSPGTSYRYRVYVDDDSGERLLFTTELLTVKPQTMVLDQNYPNPFNPSTTVSFTVPTPEHVTLKIFDVSGRHIATLVDRILTAGKRQYSWDGTGDDGNRVSSGLYFYQLSCGKKTLTKKMLILK